MYICEWKCFILLKCAMVVSVAASTMYCFRAFFENINSMSLNSRRQLILQELARCNFLFQPQSRTLNFESRCISRCYVQDLHINRCCFYINLALQIVTDCLGHSLTFSGIFLYFFGTLSR